VVLPIVFNASEVVLEPRNKPWGFDVATKFSFIVNVFEKGVMR
jgi:hypothetical protein